MTFKYVVSCIDSSRWVVRFYPKSRRDVVDFEPELLRRCRMEGSLAVPEVLGDSRDHLKAPLPYVIYRMIPGVTLTERIETMDDETLGALARQVATFLCRMSEIPVEGWGELADAWHGRSSMWIDFLVETYNSAVSANGWKEMLGKEWGDRLHRVRERMAGFAPPPLPGLAWGDLSPDNIIVSDNGALNGFVDFEGSLIAEPLLSLGYLHARAPQSRFCQALVAAWPGGLGTAEKERLELYAVVRFLRLLKYAVQPLPTGLQRTPVCEFLPGAMDSLLALADKNT